MPNIFNNPNLTFQYLTLNIPLLNQMSLLSNSFNGDSLLDYHIYLSDQLISSRYNVDNWEIKPYQDSSIVKINTLQHFNENGFYQGNYGITYRIYKNGIGSVIEPIIYIHEISPSREELRIALFDETPELKNTIFNIGQVPITDLNGNLFRIFLNFGNNRVYSAVNWKLDPVYPYTIVYKLFNPLPDDIQVNDICSICLAVSDDIIQQYELHTTEPTQEVTILKNPNWNAKVEIKKSKKETDFYNWDQLLSTNPTSSYQLVNKYFSGSLSGIDLNINYTDYNNFVFYSSAQERLNNFQYKLGLIENYTSLINTLQTQVSTSFLADTNTLQNNINKYNDKLQAIFGTFDGYDNYMYYESTSMDFTCSSWPKSNSTKPYTLYSINSNTGQNYFELQSETASIFDKQNVNALINTIPEHILMDESNIGYVTFVEMVAQHFDILWLYINNFGNIYNRQESLYNGLSKDLVYSALKSLGWDPEFGNQFEELWYSTFGGANSYMSGSDYIQVDSEKSNPTPKADISKQIWKRILNNLPFLLKNKGTSQGIRALINCVSGDTQVHIRGGLSYVKDISGKIVDTLSKDGIYRPAKWNSYGIQQLYKVIFENGDVIRATENHKWLVTNNGRRGEYKTLTTLDLIGRKIPLYSISNFEYGSDTEWIEGVRRGLIFGDGSVSYKGSSISQFGDSRHLLEDYFDDVTKHKYKDDNEGRYHTGGAHKYPIEWKTTLPDTTYSQTYIRGFIAGMIASDGSVEKCGYVMLDQANLLNLSKIRDLASYAGLPTKKITLIRVNSPFTGEYAPLYRLSFVKEGMYDEKLILKNSHKERIFSSPKPEKRATVKVIDVVIDTIEEVFCCEEPDTHTWITDRGYLTSNCYGVPDTILRIKEYGGPDKYDTISKYTYDKFLYAWEPTGSDNYYLTVSGSTFPETIEFRFKTIDATNILLTNHQKNQVIFTNTTGSIATSYLQTSYQTGINGHLVFFVKDPTNPTYTSYYIQNAPIYDGNWWTFMLRHNSGLNYDMFLKQSNGVDISLEFSSSITIPSSYTSSLNYLNMNFPGDINSSANTSTNWFGLFDGNLQELKYWNTPLSESAFDNHVNSTIAYNGNSLTASYYDLVFRLPLGTEAYLSSSTILMYTSSTDISYYTSSKHPNQLYNNYYVIGQPSTMSFVEVVEQESIQWPDCSANRVISNKIRLEDNNAFDGNTLDLKTRTEISAYDRYPNDSAKIGVYLSPTNEINEDIAQHMGGFRIDDYIGDEEDYYTEEYKDLNILRDQYFKKYNGRPRFEQYIRLLKFYDHSLFNQIKTMLPYRSRGLVGLVIEPNILERPKFKLINKPVLEDVTINTILNTSTSQHLHSDIENIEGNFNTELQFNIDYISLSSSFDTQPSLIGLNYDSNELYIDMMNYIEFDTGNPYQTMITSSTPSSFLQTYNLYIDNTQWLSASVASTEPLINSYEGNNGIVWQNPNGAKYIDANRARLIAHSVNSGSEASEMLILSNYFDTYQMDWTNIHSINGIEMRILRYGTAILPDYTTDYLIKVGINTVNDITAGDNHASSTAWDYNTWVDKTYGGINVRWGHQWNKYLIRRLKSCVAVKNYYDTYPVIFGTRPQINYIGIKVYFNKKQIKYAEIQDFEPIGYANLKYNGCKITSTDFNQPSLDTPDGGPAVEFHIVNPTTIDINASVNTNTQNIANSNISSTI